MTELSFHPGLSAAMLAAAAVAAAVLIAVGYRRAYAALRPSQWVRLYLLRMAAVALVLLLLFRPVLSFQRRIHERPDLVFLLDNSASMSIVDRGGEGSRLERARSQLLDWLGRLKDDFELHVVAFSDSAAVLEGEEQVLELAPDGQATSLSRALAASIRVAPARRIGAVFLISDGIHNSAGDPIEAASRIGVRVHAIGVGASLRGASSYRDVRLTDMECPEQMAVDNLARVKTYVEAVGFPNRVVKLVLREDDKQVAEQDLVLDDVEGSQEVALEFTPTEKGVHSYTVTVVAGSDESIVQNNERSDSALVVDARIRVLYLEGALRAEYGAIVGQFLAKDPNLEFCALVQTRPNVFVQRTNIEGLDLDTIPDAPEVLESFDVFLIGDLDSSYFQAGQLAAIRQRVLDGAGLMMIGGYHSLGPGGYAATELEAALPMLLGSRDIGQVLEPFQPQLTPEGRQHPIFANIVDFFAGGNREAEVAGLPPLEGCVRVLGAKPGASVLAVHPSEKAAGGSPLPILAVQPVGAGRAAVFTADTTRNWRQALLTMDQSTPFLRFWGQAVRWLAGRTDAVQIEAGVAAVTDKNSYQPESKVTVTAVVRGPQGEAAGSAAVKAVVRGPGGEETELTLPPVPGPAGNYRVEFQPQRTGSYEIAVRAELGELQLTAEPLAIRVGRPSLEYDRLDLDERMLTRIAEASGGQYAHLAVADRLIQRLRKEVEARRVRYELELARPSWFWLLFVAALTGEWLLRRRWRLR